MISNTLYAMYAFNVYFFPVLRLSAPHSNFILFFSILFFFFFRHIKWLIECKLISNTLPIDIMAWIWLLNRWIDIRLQQLVSTYFLDEFPLSFRFFFFIFFEFLFSSCIFDSIKMNGREETRDDLKKKEERIQNGSHTAGYNNSNNNKNHYDFPSDTTVDLYYTIL